MTTDPVITASRGAERVAGRHQLVTVDNPPGTGPAGGPGSGGGSTSSSLEFAAALGRAAAGPAGQRVPARTTTGHGARSGLELPVGRSDSAGPGRRRSTGPDRPDIGPRTRPSTGASPSSAPPVNADRSTAGPRSRTAADQVDGRPGPGSSKASRPAGVGQRDGRRTDEPGRADGTGTGDDPVDNDRPDRTPAGTGPLDEAAGGSSDEATPAAGEETSDPTLTGQAATAAAVDAAAAMTVALASVPGITVPAHSDADNADGTDGVTADTGAELAAGPVPAEAVGGEPADGPAGGDAADPGAVPGAMSPDQSAPADGAAPAGTDQAANSTADGNPNSTADGNPNDNGATAGQDPAARLTVPAPAGDGAATGGPTAGAGGPTAALASGPAMSGSVGGGGATTGAPTGADNRLSALSNPSTPAAELGLGPATTGPNPTAPTGTAVPAAGAAGPDPVWHQVQRALQAVRLTAAGDHEMTIRLRPEELGSVVVTVTTGEAGTSVSLMADNRAAASQLLQQRHLLLDQLQSRGLGETTVDVGLGARSGAGDTGPGPGDGDRRSALARGARPTASSDPLPVGPASPAGPRPGGGSTRVDMAL